MNYLALSYCGALQVKTRRAGEGYGAAHRSELLPSYYHMRCREV